jgi:hypothetical protein
MKLKDFIWIFTLLLFTLLIIIRDSRTIFEYYTEQNPYLMGFIKTSILATMGEILVNRIKTKYYFKSKGIFLKFLVWGFLGMTFVLVFKLFFEGVVILQGVNILPSIHSNDFLGRLLTAFMVSILMNIIFAPTFMIFHRITDNYIDLSNGNIQQLFHVKFTDVINRIDFNHFFSFVILKTIPFFWIPAHTITFMLNSNYRVLMAAYLSIALGFILTISKKKNINQNI